MTWRKSHCWTSIALLENRRFSPLALGTSHPGCLVEKAVNEALSESLLEAESLLLRRFEAITLEALRESFSRDMAIVRAALESNANSA